MIASADDGQSMNQRRRGFSNAVIPSSPPACPGVRECKASGVMILGMIKLLEEGEKVDVARRAVHSYLSGFYPATRKAEEASRVKIYAISIQATIMTWVIRMENGGLLNVLFRINSPSTGQEPEFDLISEVDEPVVEYFKRMLFLQPLPLTILKAIPESLGGGQAAVDNAHANPNRGPDIFWITVVTFLLSVLLIILIQVINCCCCCYKKRDSHGSMNALQIAVLRSEFANKQFILRIAYIVALGLTLVFLAISIILLIVYFSSTGLVVSYLETNPHPAAVNQTSVSLPYGLKSTISHASSFVSIAITKGRVLTNSTIHDFVDRTYTKLSREVLDAFDRLLAYLGAQNALESGEKFVNVTKNLSTHVFDAYGNVTLVHDEIASLEATLKALSTTYTQALEKIEICRSGNLCDVLKAIIPNITFPISSTKLDASLIKPYIEGLNKTIAKLPILLDEVRGSINEVRKSTNDVLDSLKSELNLKHILKQIEPFWDNAQSQADSLLKELNATVKSVETQVPKYVHDIRVGFFIVSGVFMVMLIIATLVAMRLVYRAIHDRLFAHPNTASVDSRRNKWDNVVCSKSSVCCCSALFIPLLLVFAAIIAGLLFVLTTLSSEGCIYLERKSAVRMSDFVINGYVARQWKTLISGAVGRNADFLNTSPPRNILSALTQTCNREASQHPVGLLSALGYHNLINVPKLVNSREVTDAIKQGKADYVPQRRVGDDLEIKAHVRASE
ncbi:unnamed protein product [Taenia asiatica]|uniref:Transmembrane protein n=1 Tax=Taenia asiatica TaxID=60517 RepID=A0A158R6W3_TAEAS|nr:unnamed protein product [Taenia asiatica]